MKYRDTSPTLAALALATVFGLWFVRTHKVPALGFQPIPKAAATPAKSDVENLLAAQYEVVRHVRQVPPVLKQSFTNFTSLPFDMNDPGDPMSTDDMIAAPSRQVIFAAVGKSSTVLVYEQGSFVSYPNVVVFSYGNEPKGWAATLDHYPRDIPTLQKALRQSRFKTWERTQ